MWYLIDFIIPIQQQPKHNIAKTINISHMSSFSKLLFQEVINHYFNPDEFFKLLFCDALNSKDTAMITFFDKIITKVGQCSITVAWLFLLNSGGRREKFEIEFGDKSRFEVCLSKSIK